MSIRGIFKQQLRVFLFFSLLLCFNMVSVKAETAIPKINFVGVDHSPLIQGETEKFYFTTDFDEQVQYKVYLYSLKTEELQELTNGYTEPIDGKTPYIIEPPIKFQLGKYKILAFVKRAGVEGKVYDYEFGNYDSYYQANLSCTYRDDKSRVYTENDMDIEKDTYTVGETVVIKGIKNISGMKGPYTFKLHVYDPSSGWTLDTQSYRETIEWTPTKPGVYILDLWGMSSNSTLWALMNKNPKAKYYEAWKLKVITVKKPAITINNTDGSKYVGDVDGNEANGEGTYTWLDGTTFTGKFLNNVAIGEGIFNYKDGRQKKGTWDQKDIIWQNKIEDYYYSYALSQISWMNDGKKMAINDEIVNVIDGDVINKFDNYQILFNPINSQKVMIKSNEIKVYDSNNKVTQTISNIYVKQQQTEYLCKYTMDGRNLIYVDGDGNNKVCLLNLATGEVDKIYDQITKEWKVITQLDVSPDGKKIAVVNNYEEKAIILDIQTGEVQSNIMAERATSIAFSHDSRYIALAQEGNNGLGNKVNIFDVNSGDKLKSLENHTDRINKVCYSENGKYLATASDDGSIIIYDTKEYKVLKSLVTKNNKDCVKLNDLYNISAVQNISFNPTTESIMAVYNVSKREEPKYIMWDLLDINTK